MVMTIFSHYLEQSKVQKTIKAEELFQLCIPSQLDLFKASMTHVLATDLKDKKEEVLIFS
jgi:hypothetical protein